MRCCLTFGDTWFSDSTRQLAEELQNGPLEDDERELLLLLSTPHIKVRSHSLSHRFCRVSSNAWQCLPPLILVCSDLLRVAASQCFSPWAALSFPSVCHVLHNACVIAVWGCSLCPLDTENCLIILIKRLIFNSLAFRGVKRAESSESGGLKSSCWRECWFLFSFLPLTFFPSFS